MWSTLTLLLAFGFLLSFRLRIGHTVKVAARFDLARTGPDTAGARRAQAR